MNLVSSSPISVPPEKLPGSAHGISKAAAEVSMRTLPVATAPGGAPTPTAVSSQSSWKSNWQSMLAELNNSMSGELSGAVTENIDSESLNGRSLDVRSLDVGDQPHSVQDLPVTSRSELMPSATPSVPAHLAPSMTPNLPNLILASNVLQRPLLEATITPAMNAIAPQASPQITGTQTGHRSSPLNGNVSSNRGPSAIKTTLNQYVTNVQASSVVLNEALRLPPAVSHQPIQPSASVEMSSHPLFVSQESHTDHEPSASGPVSTSVSSSISSPVSSSAPSSVSDLVFGSVSVSVPVFAPATVSGSVANSISDSVSVSA